LWVVGEDVSRRGHGQGLSRDAMTIGNVPDFDGFTERTGDKFIPDSVRPVDTIDFGVMCDDMTNGD